MLVTAVFGVPIAVSAGIYLEEYAPDSRFTSFIEANISNLAGVPSIVYGLLGLAIFVRAFQLGASLIAGALTLTLLILPIVIVSSQESLRAVPDSQRRAAYGVGATQWEVIRDVVLPAALPGIITGISMLNLFKLLGVNLSLETVILGHATALFRLSLHTPVDGDHGFRAMMIRDSGACRSGFPDDAEHFQVSLRND